MDSINGFNIYDTDEESQNSSFSRMWRHCLLILLAVVIFLCGVWAVDAVLDYVEAPEVRRNEKVDEKISQLQSKTGNLEARLEKLSLEASQRFPATCQGQGQSYSERCLQAPAVSLPFCRVPACFLDDLDMGVSGSAEPDQLEVLLEDSSASVDLLQAMPLERRCVSVPSLAHANTLSSGESIQCAGALTHVDESRETLPTLPLEIHESYEWTSDASEIIHLELWGGGGGGAGSMDALA